MFLVQMDIRMCLHCFSLVASAMRTIYTPLRLHVDNIIIEKKKRKKNETKGDEVNHVDALSAMIPQQNLHTNWIWYVRQISLHNAKSFSQFLNFYATFYVGFGFVFCSFCLFCDKFYFPCDRTIDIMPHTTLEKLFWKRVLKKQQERI